MTGRRGQSKEPAEDDALLWAKVTSTVKPLARRAPPKPAAPAKDEPAKRPLAKPKPASRLARPAPSSAPARPALPPPLSHGEAPALDRRTAQKLKRGRIPAAAELDLHGLTQSKAHAALMSFVARARNEGLRCIRIVTGKGLRAEGARGVLREAVPRWLNEAGLREAILGFDYAPPEAGGLGALVVLLRRQREEKGARPGKDAETRRPGPRRPARGRP